MTVQGPTSALTSFLREFGIQPRGHRFAPAVRPEEQEPAEEPVPPPEEGHAATVSFMVSRQNARASASAAVKKHAAKKLKLDSLDVRKCIRCSDRDANPLVSLCAPCLALTTISSAPARPARSNKRIKAKSVRAELLDDSSSDGQVSSLQNMCIKTLFQYIESVESFGVLSDASRDKLSHIICKHRMLSNEIAKLFFDTKNCSLTFNDCSELSEDLFASLAYLNRSLQRLTLKECGPITDRCILIYAETLLQLESLYLSGAFLVKDENFAKLISSLPSLTSFQIDFSEKIGMKTVQAIADKACFETLAFRHVRYFDGGCVKALSCNTGLKHLDLSYCLQVTESSLCDTIANLHLLETLAVDGCVNLGDGFLASVGSNCPDLKVLRMAELELITDAGCASLGEHLKHLETLDMSKCRQVSAGVHSLLSNNKNLSRVSLNGLREIGTETIEILIGSCDKLTEVDLSWIGSFDQHLSNALCSKFPKLNLKIWGCCNMTHEHIVDLNTRFPNLNIIGK